MNKLIITLIGLLIGAAFAPQASALPAFARQTGMECAACHQQHFPVLNSFGRAFKAGGYTMMGAQPAVEGEHLSIPDTLNAAILAKVRYQKSNSPRVDTSLNPAGTGDGQLQFGDEFSLFFGGRVADNIGVLFEGNTAAAGSLLAGVRIPVMHDVGGVKVSVIPFTTDALSVQYGYELSSGGVMRANRWAEHRREISAIQYNADRGADAGAATGVALVAQNDMGFINFTKFSPSFAPGGNGGAIPSASIGTNTYVRAALTPTVADWAMVLGGGAMSGTGYSNIVGMANAATVPAGTAPVDITTKQTFFDLQAHGEVAGMAMGLYIQTAKAPATLDSTGLVNNNAYNGGVADRTATTIGADLTVVPHALSVGAALRKAKNGKGAASGIDADNAATLTAIYDLKQNVALHLDYSKYSGSANAANPYLYTFMLEAAW